MHIDAVVMDKALERGMGGAPVSRRSKLSEREAKWVQKHVPITGLRKYLLRNAFATDHQFCAHNLYSIKRMMEVNCDKYFFGAADKFLIIGCAPNGDSIAIEKPAHKKIGFIGHEDPKNWKFVGVDLSISDFFWKSWNQEGYPCDFYEAQRES